MIVRLRELKIKITKAELKIKIYLSASSLVLPAVIINSSYEYVLDAVAEVEEQKCQEVAAADNDPTKMSSQLLNNCRKSLRYRKVRLLGNKELITGN
ncbi:hypothetical protein OIU76_017335 [Salix suchowensis]|nr:hypothetical protein OIU76_017335 [Salix suchowensis]